MRVTALQGKDGSWGGVLGTQIPALRDKVYSERLRLSCREEGKSRTRKQKDYVPSCYKATLWPWPITVPWALSFYL